MNGTWSFSIEVSNWKKPADDFAPTDSRISILWRIRYLWSYGSNIISSICVRQVAKLTKGTEGTGQYQHRSAKTRSLVFLDVFHVGCWLNKPQGRCYGNMLKHSTKFWKSCFQSSTTSPEQWFSTFQARWRLPCVRRCSEAQILATRRLDVFHSRCLLVKDLWAETVEADPESQACRGLSWVQSIQEVRR